MVAYQQGEKNKMSWQWVQQGHGKRKNKCTSHSGSPDQSYTSDPGCAASLAIRVTQEGGGRGGALESQAIPEPLGHIC